MGVFTVQLYTQLHDPVHRNNKLFSAMITLDLPISFHVTDNSVFWFWGITVI